MYSKIMVFLAFMTFLLLPLSLFVTQNVLATSFTDEYWGADDHGWEDVIGSKEYFDIFSADVSRSGSSLMVDIYTNFAGLGDDELYASCTVSGKGIGYGDLFLSNVWAPYGTRPAYENDDHGNGTLWTYGFVIDDRWWDGVSSGGGTGELYELNGTTNDANAKLSEDFITRGTFRTGQEVAVDTRGLSSISTGSWSIDKMDKFIRFELDISGTEIVNWNEVAIHWAQTCANDVIEGSVPVPEPATMLLLGAGLIGLAGLRRRMFCKNC